VTQKTIQEQVIARAIKDANFRQALLDNPRAVLAREYNVQFPDQVMVNVLEDALNTFTLVLPAQTEAIAELTDAEMQAASGGRPYSSSRSCGEEIPQIR
jgi:hypothetical protein